MKKLMFLMMALLVAPAMADVTISVVDNGDCTADLVIVADGDDVNEGGDSLVAGVALDVSVDAGEILEVINYKATGESVDGDEGYGIYLGTITFTGGDPEEIADVGTPVAPDTAPDNPPQLPGPACTLEFGALYNVNTPEAAPLANTTLCTLVLSETATVSIAGDDTRGGPAVLIGGGPPSNTVLNGADVICGPACWSYDCFLSGDATGDCALTFSDVQVVIAAWPPNPYDPCADFTQDTAITFSDVQVLIAHWPPNPGCDVSCVPVP